MSFNRVEPSKGHKAGKFAANERVVYVDTTDKNKKERVIGSKGWDALSKQIDPATKKLDKPKARYRMVAVEVLETPEEDAGNADSSGSSESDTTQSGTNEGNDGQD